MRKQRRFELLKLASKRCDQCLFSKDRIVSPERAKELIKQCKKKDDHFLCHKGTIAGIKLVCHGFHSKYTSIAIRIAKHFKLFTHIDPDQL